MTSDVNDADPRPQDDPLQDFSNCHVGIIEHFENLRRLPALLSQPDKAQEVRRIAADMHRFFYAAVLEHHTEEEEELFTAVSRSAEPGEEAERVKALITCLVDEHRKLEALWQRIEDDVKRLGKGKPVVLDAALVQELANAYLAHARFEEAEFLPLSAKILSKNDKSALGLSLHLRHSIKNVRGYI